MKAASWTVSLAVYGESAVRSAADALRSMLVIKYLGSKRVLVPVLGGIASAVEVTHGGRPVHRHHPGGPGVQAAGDRGHGDRRGVVQRGAQRLLHRHRPRAVDQVALRAELARLNALPGEPGYVTRTFCEESRYFQPRNGARIDAIRAAIEQDHPAGPLRAILLTALMLAADRVDSTTGLQMAYLKQWSPRSHRDLELRLPELLPGTGRTVRGDAVRDRGRRSTRST